MTEIMNHVSQAKLASVDELKPNPRNPNFHPQEQIDAFAEVLKYNGWRRPITVSARSGFIVKGHGALEAAKKLGLSFVPVEYQDYADEEHELADMIADNELASMSKRSDAQLGELLKSFSQNSKIPIGQVSASTAVSEERIIDLLKNFKDVTFESNQGVDLINKGDENSAWVGMPEFKESDKDIKLTVVFQTEEARETFVAKNELPITDKKCGQWTSRL